VLSSIGLEVANTIEALSICIERFGWQWTKRVNLFYKMLVMMIYFLILSQICGREKKKSPAVFAFIMYIGKRNPVIIAGKFFIAKSLVIRLKLPAFKAHVKLLYH
jgi:hypothetical protein